MHVGSKPFYAPVLKMKTGLSRRESAFPIQTRDELLCFFFPPEAVLSERHVIIGQMGFAGFVFPEQCKQNSYKGCSPALKVR